VGTVAADAVTADIVLMEGGVVPVAVVQEMGREKEKER
jgi:hypothetical protein